MAMNAYRNYNINTSALSKNLEKLSSGYRINRAGDDAAGLAISEKMRAQITGLNAAQKNVKDGISLVKTAEGAMQEIQDMLNRMAYLATQSANGTYDDGVDRNNLQKEVDALKSEIDRIADSANFNGISLLDGSLSASGKVTTVELRTWSDLTAGATNASNAGTSLASGKLARVGDGTPVRQSAKGKYELDLSKASWTSSTSDGQLVVTLAGMGTYGTITIDAEDKNITYTGKDIADMLISNTGGSVTISGKEFKITHDGNGKLTFTGKDTSEFSGNPQLSITVSTTDMKKDNSQAGHPDGDKANGSIDGGNQAWVQGFTELEAPVDAANQLAAQAKFMIATTDLKDGLTIKIGDNTYTFAIGKDSKFKGKEGVIDMTDIDVANDANAAAIAARRLSGAANNNAAVFVECDGTTGTVYLTEKIGGLDRNKWDVVGENTKNALDATWATSDDESFVRFGTADPSMLTDANQAAGGLQLQIGDTSASYNQLNVIVGDMHVAALGIANLSISTATDASGAIQTIRDAINNVSSIRGDLGAVQNRLEHTQNNLSVMAENIQDAESTIRDTDVAEEMMAYVKNNILIQSAQAMLAQANQIPQGVLQLLG